MVKGLVALSAALVGAFALAATASANSQETYPLIAGGGNAKNAVEVGTVTVENDGTELIVRYELTEDLTPDDPSDDGVPTLMYSTHVAVVDDGDEGSIPQAKGNPVPGHFDYADKHSPGVSLWTYIIPLEGIDENGNGELSLAVHADVKKLGGIRGVNLGLPQDVTFKVTHPGDSVGDLSYFDATFLSGYQDGSSFDGWCVDTSRGISPGTTYSGTAYSGYEELPAGSVDKPENMDLVTWLINNYRAGQSVTADVNNDGSDETRTLTFGDIQRAIWYLIDDNQSSAGLGPYNDAWAGWLRDQALANGEGLVPGCGDKVPVVIVPTGSNQRIIAQVTFAELEVPCETIGDTAWATMGTTPVVGRGKKARSIYNNAFDGKNWAAWISYQLDA